jgi:hypothetical protein
VACPTCGSEVIAEKIRLDVHKLSGQNSAWKHLNFRIEGSRKTTEKLLQAWTDLGEKFVQQDEIALLISLAREQLAKVKLSRAESEKSKPKTIHYQDPMDVDSDEIDKSTRGTLSILGESPVSIAGTSFKISTKESQEIHKSHTSGGNRTAL